MQIVGPMGQYKNEPFSNQVNVQPKGKSMPNHKQIKFPMVCSQYAPWYINARSGALGYVCQMMGHPMNEIGVLIKGHDNPSNTVNLRGIGESLM